MWQLCFRELETAEPVWIEIPSNTTTGQYALPVLANISTGATFLAEPTTIPSGSTTKNCPCGKMRS